jgi:hypothetical protein
MMAALRESFDLVRTHCGKKLIGRICQSMRPMYRTPSARRILLSDLQKVFDCRKLPRQRQEHIFTGYRGMSSLPTPNLSFCVLLDARRPDLREQWYTVMSCVRPMDLTTRCKILTWQELSAALPLRLQRFLELKYGLLDAL